MRAVAILAATGAPALLDVEPPELRGPTDVELAILDAGICGTDREIAAGTHGAAPPGVAHLVLGHEALGEVVRTGADVTGFAPGQLAVPSVRRPCPHAGCLPCRTGRQDFCATGAFTERGIKLRHGFMTERVVVDAQYLTPVPARLREVGVLLEPLTIAEKALRQVERLQQRLPWYCDAPAAPPHGCHRALVLGAGPVGLLGAMAIASRGFATHVYSHAAPDDRAPIVAALGATFLPAEATPAAELGARHGPFDLIYEATGAARTAFEALAALAPNGIYVFTGVPGRRGASGFGADELMRRLVLQNQVVLGTVNAGAGAFAAAVADLDAFVARWPDAVRRLIAGRWPLAAGPELLRRRPPGVKHLLVPEPARVTG
jgi:threonine dehydrogenase-like Zn-dependent dehydrogenase